MEEEGSAGRSVKGSDEDRQKDLSDSARSPKGCDSGQWGGNSTHDSHASTNGDNTIGGGLHDQILATAGKGGYEEGENPRQLISFLKERKF